MLHRPEVVRDITGRKKTYVIIIWHNYMFLRCNGEGLELTFFISYRQISELQVVLKFGKEMNFVNESRGKPRSGSGRGLEDIMGV